MIKTRVAHNKLPESTLRERCDKLGLIYEGNESKNQRTYVIFTCPKHANKGQQRAAWCHFKDCVNGCAYCCGKRKTTEDFRAEMAEKNPDVVILGEYQSARTKIECECKRCGNHFNMIPNALLCGQGCPECSKRISRGEERIKKYLVSNHILFIHGHSFDDCKYKKTLWFDFYLPEFSMTIEYDGIQHFQSVNFMGKCYSDFETDVKRDRTKDAYCASHGITMLRIPYYDYDQIEEILDKTFQAIRSSETARLPMAT